MATYLIKDPTGYALDEDGFVHAGMSGVCAGCSADGTTHHLIPRGPSTARVHVCRYCNATERELRERSSEQPTHQHCERHP